MSEGFLNSQLLDLLYPGVGAFLSINEDIYGAHSMQQWEQPGQFMQVLDTFYLGKL